MLRRYSSRREKLDKSFLINKLSGAKAYDRIAGYFSSSILELASEELENMEGIVRVVCNSDLNKEDVMTATLAKNAMRKEWCEFKPEEIHFTSLERLEKLYNLLKDGKLQYDLLVKESWKEKGCIIFSQYFDSAYWIAESLSKDIKGETIGIYAGGDKSGIIIDGIYTKRTKEEIKSMVKRYEIKVLLGTDAASEGLNLQTLGTLINLDLPWNPTRLEQRKGRIQRIGQANDLVYIWY